MAVTPFDLADCDLKVAIRYGESIRQHMIDINAFDAAQAMRDLLDLARWEQKRREDEKES